MALKLQIDQTVDRTASVRRFAETGRTQAKDLLTKQSAKALFETIEEQPNWNAVFDRAGQNVPLNAGALSTLSEPQMRGLLGHLGQTAATRFQYFFNSVPLYDIYHGPGTTERSLKAIYEFINGDAFLAQCRELTGMDAITFADAQITRYGPGQFLTRHDDNVEGKNRLAAYVLNLTPKWRAEWGGTLEFYDEPGNVLEGFTPAFNALNLFKVPQSHAVTYVPPFAQGYRYAITGWLRHGEDPKGN
ncbi:MAG: 2OG-Fe(II) oxygenase family protein [Henriciella sp.]|jgi:Rps23 Pro-64 3,4-dihydroxylase Tpa1-like proline 4-hydroxylase